VATDTATSLNAGTSGTTLLAAAANHFSISAPSNPTAGSAFSFTITALDAFGNTDTAYGDTLHFTSTDGAAVLHCGRDVD